MPQPSPFAVAYGSFDQFVERKIIPGIQAGLLDRKDMIDVVAALRSWELKGFFNKQLQGHAD
jgi:hypothetical protein